MAFTFKDFIEMVDTARKIQVPPSMSFTSDETNSSSEVKDDIGNKSFANVAQYMASDNAADESTGWIIVAGVTGVVVVGSLVAGGVWFCSRLNKAVERYHGAVAYSANDPKGT
jgi:hypothetical protein